MPSMHAASLPQQIIARKRDGHPLNAEEIGLFIHGATDGTWSDDQIGAMLMAIFLRGMNSAEVSALTEETMSSGEIADLSSVSLPKIDKHSTGGVGDKVSIHLAPMVATCGVAVPMISGRALGHTGGTLDKLESIPGFRVNLSLAEFREQMERIGVAIVGQTAELAPADKKLYEIRNLTATVESLPLICASILGKKLAEGIDSLVLDVKFGRGAFMRDKARAHELAAAMVALGRAMCKPTRAILTAMHEPLGRSVGNALEVAESVACLQGHGPEDVMEVTYALGSQMLLLAGIAHSAADARGLLTHSISSGAALMKFREIVEAQGGNPMAVGKPEWLPAAKHQFEIASERAGYVIDVNALDIANAALRLGAGRSRAGADIDPAVGVNQLAKTGETVLPGSVLAVVHANDEAKLAEARAIVRNAIAIGDEPVTPPRLIEETLG